MGPGSRFRKTDTEDESDSVPVQQNSDKTLKEDFLKTF